MSRLKVKESLKVRKKMAKLIEITGKALSGEWGKDDETGNGVPVLRTTNFTNEGIIDYNSVVTRTITKKNIGEKFLRKGDIIIEKSGGSDKFPVGRVVYFDGDDNTYLFNNFTGLLRVKEPKMWYPRYVFYSLFANYKRGGTRMFENKTTGLHNLKTDDYVSRYEVTEIDMIEQVSVCDKLDKLYEIINERKQQLELLDELVKARFVEMFGDARKNPNKYDTVSFIDIVEYMGDIGSNGANKVVVDHLDMKDKEDYAMMVRFTNFTKNDFTDDVKYVSKEAYDFFKKSQIFGGELIICKIGSAGQNYVMPYLNRPVSLGLNQIMVRIKDNILMPYLYQYLHTDYGEFLISGCINGAVTKTITKTELKKIPVMLPPMELQREFVAFVEQVDKSKVAIKKSLDETQILFDSLMQKYFG